MSAAITVEECCRVRGLAPTLMVMFAYWNPRQWKVVIKAGDAAKEQQQMIIKKRKFSQHVLVDLSPTSIHPSIPLSACPEGPTFPSPNPSSSAATSKSTTAGDAETDSAPTSAPRVSNPNKRALFDLWNDRVAGFNY
ncbi:hypothetical protein PILCRDRAFT_14328 [Piloderma croceum F 1598]|uniref:Uncharacterized protein n=1 Tax=Piloderma croceum (strain F 1598) TaxID=765440 RepID=A0A0C3EPP8_PILCF|nr:hypothetical protein PILCRDRAFT_14328 [Piloderma croceum F 1598]